MEERRDVVRMKGKPLTLVGNVIKLGEKAPDVEVIDNDLNSITLFLNQGKFCLILSVPSLDTSVCNREAHHFNKELEKYGDRIKTFVVSMDLPFAQKRWYANESSIHIQTVSDHKKAEFGEKYGVLIKELRLLARAIFLIDEEGFIRFIHFNKELSEEPPYPAILEKVNQLITSKK